jgi:uncharacterized coiled-coil protein SlyX
MTWVADLLVRVTGLANEIGRLRVENRALTQALHDAQEDAIEAAGDTVDLWARIEELEEAVAERDEMLRALGQEWTS